MRQEGACPPLVELEEHASGRSHGPRSSWLAQHAGSCADCGRMLSDLLADRALESRLQHAFGAATGARAWPEIAGYRILGELGRGGMGVVYEAEQLASSRRVALKVVRGAQYVDDTTLKLFQREIRVLARLEHPAVASLYDAGSTSGGEHYFAMELVRGTSLVEHARGLARAERLRLFGQLCGAIDFAHQRGVVHRDLKPSNVLVTAEGRVKVLDFGLAKITDQDVSQSSRLSEAGQIRGTLAYMSPEQARGDPAAIDLSSDVYSLGVILYELLTGELPVDVFRVHIHEASRRISEDAPRRPAALDATLRGDLETIVLKALEKQPARRYASAAALGEDVRRFLADEVILARPPSTVYELRQLVRRHTLACSLAATIFVLSLGATVWTAALYRREAELHGVAERETQRALAAGIQAEASAAEARAEAEHARREARTYERVKDFLLGVFGASSADARRAEQVTADELLARGAERIQRELVEDKPVRAALLQSLGDVCRGLGLHSRARPLLEEALALRRELAPGTSTLAASLAALGLELEGSGDPAAAVPLQREALALFEELEGEHSRNALIARSNLAQALYTRGDAGAAEQELRTLLERWDAAGLPHDDSYHDKLNSLGLALYELDRPAEAEPLLQQAVDALRAGGPSLRLANSINTLGMLWLERGRLDEAERGFAEALALRLSLLDDTSPILASSYNNLAAVASLRGQPRPALENLERAHELLAREHRPGDPDLAQNDHNRARTYLSLGELEQAEACSVLALEARRRTLGERHAATTESLVVLAEVQMRKKDLAVAEETLLRAVPAFDEALGRGHRSAIHARFRLGQVLEQQKRWPEAERWTREALEDLRGGPAASPDVEKAIEGQLERIRRGAAGS